MKEKYLYLLSSCEERKKIEIEIEIRHIRQVLSEYGTSSKWK